MPANLENSAVATGLEKVSFHSNPKERQCQRMLKLLHNCTHLTRYQSNAQNSQSRLQQYVKHELPDVQDGFKATNYDNMVVEILYGEGENNLTILAHADVVPEGAWRILSITLLACEVSAIVW